MKTHRIKNKLFSIALCFVMLLGVYSAFTLVKPQSVANAAETTPKQVAQWSGYIPLSEYKNSVTNVILTNGFAWYKDAAKDTPYGDLKANTLVLDGLNIACSELEAISFDGKDAETELNIILAEGSMNSIFLNKWLEGSTSVKGISVKGSKTKTIISGKGILEVKTEQQAVWYGDGIYSEGIVTQEDGDIRLFVNTRGYAVGVNVASGYTLSNGKLRVGVSGQSDTRAIINLIMASGYFIKEDGVKYVKKGEYMTLLSQFDEYIKNVTLEVVKADTYTVTYDANGATSGTAPIDSTKYAKLDFAITKDKGDLAKTGYTFVGWTTTPNGSGARSPGASIAMDRNITFYAKWVLETPSTITPTITGFSAIRTSESAATIKFTTNVDGGYYIIIVDKGTPRPNNPSDNDWTACSAGEQTIRFNNLTAGEKDIYIFIKGNSTEVVEIETISADVEKGDDKLSAGVIVVIALSASLGLLLILIVLYILWKYGILKGKAANILIGWIDPAAVKVCKIFCKKDKLFTVKGTKGEQ